jgi:hypothetical protein
MAKPTAKTKKPQSFKTGKQKKDIVFPLERTNLMIIGLGIVLLVIGYVFMAENSVDGFLPTVAAPILLVLGYCVVIPYGIIKKPAKVQQAAAGASPPENISAEQASQSASSNIKTG